MRGINETETVIRKILPYLERREYDVLKDLDFETAIKSTDRYSKGYADIIIKCGQPTPLFVIEAKRSGRVLADKDKEQALEYGAALGCLFVVVTNGTDIRCFNVTNGKSIAWNGKLIEKIPTRSQAFKVVGMLKSTKDLTDIPLRDDESLPYRPGLPFKQLNALFYRCHSAIREIEKNEDEAFSDFSKMLFLKLLEEKADAAWAATSGTKLAPSFELPYSARFHELAKYSENESDKVLAIVKDMIEQIRQQEDYRGVLPANLSIRNSKTVRYLAIELSKISFQDSAGDVKGTAFEYFVRATLRGKRLGQYFTPRNLIAVMSAIVGREKILNALRQNSKIKMVDPACGTGGFMVYLMRENLRMLDVLLKKRSVQPKQYNDLVERLLRQTFYGSDANLGVAAARMNLIVAGDGHSNIRHEDSLSSKAVNWSMRQPDCDIILTNPPFGTSESQSLSKEDKAQYSIPTPKGQLLFIQKMVLCTVGGGDICTVIDEGVLSTRSSGKLRRWLFQTCRVVAVVELPDETFKPNKINVKSAVLYLQRRDRDDIDFDDNYQVTFCQIDSLGYRGDGDAIRGFTFQRLVDEIAEQMLDIDKGNRNGYHWCAYNVNAQEIIEDKTCRLDYKYWLPSTRQRIKTLKEAGAPSIGELNLYGETIQRGDSPDESTYVDEADGYALVVKSGSNISKYGELIVPYNSDYIEQNVYEEMSRAHIREGDVLLSSTGDGTAGKCCVYRLKKPAIAEGHITIIRPHTMHVWPEYLADYLRAGFGNIQVNRLITGATGMVELHGADVPSIVVPLLSGIEEQKRVSERLREHERKYREAAGGAESILEKARREFAEL